MQTQNVFQSLQPPVSPLRPYVVTLTQHFEKLAQQILWEWVKKDAFSWKFSKFLAKANDFGARTPPILTNLVKLAQAQKP